MRVIWSEHARAQVRDIFEYVAEDRPQAAQQLLEALIERTSLLLEFPDQGSPWGRPIHDDLRSVFVHSYRIVYSVHGDSIAIHSVRHTRMADSSPEELGL